MQILYWLGSYLYSDAVLVMLTHDTCVLAADINGDGSKDLVLACPIARGDPALGTFHMQSFALK